MQESKRVRKKERKKKCERNQMEGKRQGDKGGEGEQHLIVLYNTFCCARQQLFSLFQTIVFCVEKKERKALGVSQP